MTTAQRHQKWEEWVQSYEALDDLMNLPMSESSEEWDQRDHKRRADSAEKRIEKMQAAWEELKKKWRDVR